MRKKIAKNCGRVVQFAEVGEAPAAIYPDQISAARIMGCSRQAIQQAIKNGTKVKGFFWLRFNDYEKMVRANRAAQAEYLGREGRA